MEPSQPETTETTVSQYQFPSRPSFTEGYSGESVQLSTNHFSLDFKAQTVYQYHFVIDPTIPEDSRQLRQSIVNEATGPVGDKIGAFYASGYAIYAL